MVVKPLAYSYKIRIFKLNSICEVIFAINVLCLCLCLNLIAWFLKLALYGYNEL